MAISYRLTDLAFARLLECDDVPFESIALYDLIRRRCPESFAHLAKLSGRTRKMVRKECEVLRELGWLKFEVARSSSTVIIPTAPLSLQLEFSTEVVKLRRLWPRKGESIMKGMLDNIVQSWDYLDNCRPQRMLNPETGRALELDRFYYPHVAFEFQGTQHYELTALHKDNHQFERAKLLDLAKVGLGVKNSIQIVEITAADLTIEGIIARIPDALAIQRIDTTGPYI